MGRRVLIGKQYILSVLISVQLLCFPMLALVDSVGAEEAVPFSLSTDSKADETPHDLMRTAGGVIQLEKVMPESPQENGAPSSPVVEAQVTESVQSESSVPSEVEAVSTMKTGSFVELEDPFKAESPDLPELKDPFVGFNRFMYNVNESIYENVMDPVSRRYRDWVDEDVRISIRNVFGNASSAVKFVSSLFQADFGKVARVIGRLVINSTIGIGGLFDVAEKHFHIEDVNEDFGQALGYLNVPSGPYIVIPFLGPSTARDVVGRVVDSFLTPSIIFAPGFAAGAGMSLGDKINANSFILDDKKQLDDSALDEYESIRDFYHQYREGLIRK